MRKIHALLHRIAIRGIRMGNLGHLRRNSVALLALGLAICLSQVASATSTDLDFDLAVPEQTGVRGGSLALPPAPADEWSEESSLWLTRNLMEPVYRRAGKRRAGRLPRPSRHLGRGLRSGRCPTTAKPNGPRFVLRSEQLLISGSTPLGVGCEPSRPARVTLPRAWPRGRNQSETARTPAALGSTAGTHAVDRSATPHRTWPPSRRRRPWAAHRSES